MRWVPTPSGLPARVDALEGRIAALETSRPSLDQSRYPDTADLTEPKSDPPARYVTDHTPEDTKPKAKRGAMPEQGNATNETPLHRNDRPQLRIGQFFL